MQSDRTIFLQSKAQLIRKVQETKNRLQQVITVFPASHHMQEKIDLGGCGANKHGHRICICCSGLIGFPLVNYQFYSQFAPVEHQHSGACSL